jgi:hypothetical protein
MMVLLWVAAGLALLALANGLALASDSASRVPAVRGNIPRHRGRSRWPHERPSEGHDAHRSWARCD